MDKIIGTDLQENKQYFDQRLRTDQNFDMISRRTSIAGRQACYYFVDGFVKDDIMEKLLEFFYSLTPEDLPESSQELSIDAMPYVEVALLEQQKQIEQAVLSGQVCFFIDGYAKCFAIDCRTYPMRGVEEPDKDKVLRGPRDGFVETVVCNTALIRRRIRDTDLSMQMHTIGRTSKTDVVLCYMESRTDKVFLDQVQKRLSEIRTDALSMGQESLAECLYPRKWYNPFPKFKYTERPDTAAAELLEGKLVLITDNSPAVMILPVTLFDVMEEADDFYFPPVTGTYLRLSRLLIACMTLLLTPTWLLFMDNPQWIPEMFQFIQIQDGIHVPVFWQLLLLEFAIDGMKLAAINTPSVLSTPLSVIAGIVVGEFAVKSGWFNSETMLYMAFVAIANYTQASYELGYALKFMRMILLVLTGLFQLYGYIGGLILVFLLVLTNKTVSGKSYLYPLIPFDGKQLGRRIFRKRIRSDCE